MEAIRKVGILPGATGIQVVTDEEKGGSSTYTAQFRRLQFEVDENSTKSMVKRCLHAKGPARGGATLSRAT